MSAGAAAADELLRARARTARALGAREDLVLDGGGNASVKTAAHAGGADALLWVTASGADLAQTEAGSLVPLDLRALRALRDAPPLSEEALVDALASCRLRPADPAASIESQLHGWLPARFVDHSHAAAVQALGNTEDGEAHLRSALGEELIVVPALPSGDPLARAVDDAFAASLGIEAGVLVLRHHGIVSWGPTADGSLSAHIAAVSRAEQYLDDHDAPVPVPSLASARSAEAEDLVGKVLETLHASRQCVWREVPTDPRFFELADAEERASAGPVTPGDLLRLGAAPLWRAASSLSGPAVSESTRSVLCPDIRAAFVCGADSSAAASAADVFRQDLATRLRSSVLGPWRSLDMADRRAAMNSFLEQAKYSRARSLRP